MFKGIQFGALAAGFAAFALAISCQAQTQEAKPKEKLVLTHVMHQMAVGAVNRPNETHLSVEPSRENGIMAQHCDEYYQNYGKPLDAARQDIAMMRGTGVDAIGLLLCNGHLKSQFAPMINAYYQAALEDGRVKIAPDSWGDIYKPEGLAEIYGELAAKYPNAWLKRDGRYVVIIMPPHYGAKPLPDFAETTGKLFAPLGGRKNVYLVLYMPANLKTANPAWFEGADAFTSWLTDSYGNSCADLAAETAAAKSSGKEFWSPVMPAFQQSRYPHENGKFIPNLREKLGVAWFRKSWLAAIGSDAPAVCLQTWNDLSEDSAVMPESNHGYAYYDLNAYFAKRFKSGAEPAVEKERLLVFHHPQLVEGLKLPPGVKPMEGFPFAIGKDFNSPPINRTPPTDYVAVAAFLKKPALVSVLLGESAIAKREMPAGVSFWLVYQPRNLNDPAKRYVCDPAKVYPQSEPGFEVSPIEKPFFDAELFVSAERDGQRLGFFRSKKPVAGAAGRGDLSVCGDVLELER